MALPATLLESVKWARHLVVGGLAAAEVIVVHGGEVIVDERHGVQHLHGTGCGHGLRDAAPDSLACSQR